MFSMGCHVLPGFSAWGKGFGTWYWNETVDIMHRKRNMLYTRRDSFSLIPAFYSSKTNLMGFIIMWSCLPREICSSLGEMLILSWKEEKEVSRRLNSCVSSFYRLLLKQMDRGIVVVELVFLECVFMVYRGVQLGITAVSNSKSEIISCRSSAKLL